MSFCPIDSLYVPSSNIFFDHQQVSELAEEQEVRDLFERFGRVTRVFLARDRETQRAKGFAFISYADRTDAELACDKMDGCMFPPFIGFFFPALTDSSQSVTATSFSTSSLPSVRPRLVFWLFCHDFFWLVSSFISGGPTFGRSSFPL